MLKRKKSLKEIKDIRKKLKKKKSYARSHGLFLGLLINSCVKKLTVLHLVKFDFNYDA